MTGIADVVYATSAESCCYLRQRAGYLLVEESFTNQQDKWAINIQGQSVLQ